MLAKWLSELWCDWMHDSPMWPIHGRYQCRVCGRIYRVLWTESSQSPNNTALPAWEHALAGR